MGKNVFFHNKKDGKVLIRLSRHGYECRISFNLSAIFSGYSVTSPPCPKLSNFIISVCGKCSFTYLRSAFRSPASFSPYQY